VKGKGNEGGDVGRGKEEECGKGDGRGMFALLAVGYGHPWCLFVCLGWNLTLYQLQALHSFVGLR